MNPAPQEAPQYKETERGDLGLFLPVTLTFANHVSSVPPRSKADFDTAVVSEDPLPERPQPWGALSSLSSSAAGKEQHHQLCAYITVLQHWGAVPFSDGPELAGRELLARKGPTPFCRRLHSFRMTPILKN